MSAMTSVMTSAVKNDVHELLAELADLNVKLWAEDNRLRMSAPKGVLTLALQDQVRTHKIEILGLLTGGHSRYPKLHPYARTGAAHNEAPLSYAQQRLWFLKQLEGDTNAAGGYLIPGALQLRGKLDVARLHASLNQLVARHESLRTTIHENDGVPVQRIAAAHPIKLPLFDLRAFPSAQRQTLSQNIAAQEMARPFDLAQDPLLRCVLVQTDEQEFLLFVLMHHIIADGWSMPIFAGEVAHGYDKPDRPLPALRIQYADFAQWQREWLQGDALQTQLDYWKQKLAGVPPLLALPTDRPRNNTPNYTCGTLNFALEANVVTGLRNLAQQHGATHYMVVLAAFAMLLSRYSNQQDVVLGSPTANRVDPELEQLIGFFVNTLALRVNVQATSSFAELLQQVKQTTLDAYAHQDTPIEQIVDALHLPRTLSHAPLFQVLFSWLNQTGNADMDKQLNLQDLEISPVAWDKTTLEFDLVLSINETQTGWFGAWQYSTELFDEATLHRMVAHFQNILASVVAQPDAPLSTLPMLSPAEAQHMLVAWNEPPAPWRGEDAPACIHELFAAQALRTPHAVALVCGNASRTYAELNAQADAIAHGLNARGLGVGQRIGICAERSIDMMLAVLGVMKSGAAYVPLDPDYPAERLAALQSDAHLSAVVAQEHLAARCSGTVETVLTVDQLISEGDTAQGALSALSGAKPDDPIYMIYTSGSTGQPKGVLVAHKGVANTVRAMARAAGLHSGDRFLQFVPFAFDASAVEFFTTLLTGATLVLHRDVTRLSTSELHALCVAQDITTLHFTTALWQQWVDNAQQQGLRFPAQLRNFMTGGEKPSPQALRTWAGLADHEMTFISAYGPTEAAIATNMFVTTNHAVQHNPPDEIGLGATIPNMGIYVLDAQQQLAPIGVTGELYLGGVGVAAGYWQREAQTRAHFFEALPAVNAHLRENAPQRFYRTGDLVRWLPNGTCEYVGRADSQVKVRGFRIELGEIETQLKKLAHVREAIVLALQFGNNDKRVVAYVEFEPVIARSAAQITAQSAPSNNELNTALSAVLPSHMLPSVWVTMSGWPLTPNGKLDRNALPKPELSDTSDTYIAPRNATEKALTDIWCEVLGLTKISIATSFFDLGGHSLLATQVVSRIRQVLHIDVPLRVLFEQPSIAGLAQWMNQHDAQPANTHPPIVRVERDAVMPVSFAQQRLWLIDQLDGARGGYVIPTALKLNGVLDKERLQASLSALVARHESLRTTFEAVEGVPMQRIHPPAPVALPCVDLRHMPAELREDEAQRQANESLYQPMNLASGPLLRCALFQLDEQTHVLFMLMHHIITDGWSVGIMLGEVMHAYAHPDVALPELAVQYADYAVWQRNWLQGDVLQAQLTYWTTQLADAPLLLELPTDRPRSNTPSYKSDEVPFVIEADLMRRLNALAHANAATPFMVMLAAYGLLLSRYSGQGDVVIGTPIANRTDAAVEPLIGFFINMLAMRLNVNDASDFAALLRQTQRVALESYAHQDISFEQIVDALKLPHALSHTPVFQAAFAWQNFKRAVAQSDSADSADALNIQEQAWKKATLEYDVMVWMQPNDYAENAEADLHGTWEFSTDLFDRTTAERMVAHYKNLLQAIAAHAQSDLALSALPVLSAAEAQRTLEDWNATSTAFDETQGFHHVFEAQVAKTPNAIAVKFENTQLTYVQLNQHANRLAHQFKAQGVKENGLVALLADRSPDFLALILAVFKAGGAYLPLDTRAPATRYAQILAQSQTALVVTSQAYEATMTEALREMSADKRPRVLRIEDLKIGASEKGASGDAPLLMLASGNVGARLAYVIYTSGSTGTPKGAMVQQRGMVNHIYAKIKDLQLTANDAVAQTAPQSFVISVWQFLAPLAVGGCVHIFGDDIARDPRALFAHVARHTISFLEVVPSLLRIMLDETQQTDAPDLACLRRIVLTGEALPPSLARRWLAQYPTVPMLNAYGPTECADDVTHYAVNTPPGEQMINMPIGRPIQNMRVLVLDAHMQPVPIGVTGQLFIGGVGVGLGYIHDAERTSQAFLRDPFSTNPQARLYKTGDKARYLPDGNIEYLGRLDFQVKIRGIRIELGEIEAVLSRHAQVAQCVLTARNDAQGAKQLVAYAVLQPGADVKANDLRDWVRQSLPDYMVPSVVMLLDALPLNNSGKVARNLLPDPAPAQPADASSYLAARNETEQSIIAILSQVTGVEASLLGVRHNFFDLGVHSMQAVQIVWQLRNRFGVDLPLRGMFENTTVESLAQLVDEAVAANGGRRQAWTPLVPLQVAAGRPKIYFVHASGGALFWYLQLLKHLGDDVNAVGIQGHGLYGEQQALQDIPQMAKAYCEAIKQSQPNGPYYLVGYSMGGVLAYEMAQRLRANGDEVGLLGVLDSYMFTERLPYPGRGIKNKDEKLIAQMLNDWDEADAMTLLKEIKRMKNHETRIAYLLQRGKQAGLIPAEHGAEELRRAYTAIECHVEAMATYKPQPYAGALTFFQCTDRTGTNFPARKWTDLVARGLTVHAMPGNHATVMEEPHVQTLAAALRMELDKALAR